MAPTRRLIAFNDACAEGLEGTSDCTNLEGHGDREVGAKYAVSNYQSNEAGLVSVAMAPFAMTCALDPLPLSDVIMVVELHSGVLRFL